MVPHIPENGGSVGLVLCYVLSHDQTMIPWTHEIISSTLIIYQYEVYYSYNFSSQIWSKHWNSESLDSYYCLTWFKSNFWFQGKIKVNLADSDSGRQNSLSYIHNHDLKGELHDEAKNLKIWKSEKSVNIMNSPTAKSKYKKHTKYLNLHGLSSVLCALTM